MAESELNLERHLMFEWSRPSQSVDRGHTDMMDGFVVFGELVLRVSFEDHIRKARGRAIAMTVLEDGTPAKGRTCAYIDVGCEKSLRPSKEPHEFISFRLFCRYFDDMDRMQAAICFRDAVVA